MRVLIVLVNWNGWSDAIECLESLRRCEGSFDIVLCDNGSTDDSIEKIQAWCDGERVAATDGPPWKTIRDAPVLHSPTCRTVDSAATVGTAPHWLTIIPAGGNLGFAGGNNVGLRYGLTGDYDAFWLLNTDTVIDPTALRALIARVEADPTIGQCGSTVVYYADPAKTQCFGGAQYLPAKAGGRYIGYLENPDPTPAAAEVEARLDYIVGASMFVSRAFVEKVGLMSEDYFLYFEEMDWSARDRGRHRIGYAPDCRVYHKHGGSTGGSSANTKPSKTLLIYSGVNRIFFTRRFYKPYLPLVMAAVAVDCVKLALKGYPRSALSLLSNALAGFSQGGAALQARVSAQ